MNPVNLQMFEPAELPDFDLENFDDLAVAGNPTRDEDDLLLAIAALRLLQTDADRAEIIAEFAIRRHKVMSVGYRRLSAELGGIVGSGRHGHPKE
jgi:hypothetical protein